MVMVCAKGDVLVGATTVLGIFFNQNLSFQIQDSG